MQMLKKHLNKVIIIAFIFIIYLPVIQMNFNIFHIKTTLNEKREKAKLPAVSMDTIASGAFMSDFEKYFNDNFGFRDELIKLSSEVDLNLFKTSSNSRVIIGKNDYLYYSQELNDYNKTPSLTEQQISEVAKKFAVFQKELNKRGIDFLFVVGPNKSTIYPEYMPKPRTNANGVTNYDILLKYLQEEKVNHIDLIPILMENKSKYELYYKRDTHWNLIAGVISSQQILENLGNKYQMTARPKITSLTKDIYGGDLNDMLGIDFKVGVQKPNVDFGNTIVKMPKVLWYNDSFSEAIIPYVQPYFAQFINFHYGNNPVESTFAENIKDSKIVVFETVERSIPALPDYNLDVFKDKN